MRRRIAQILWWIGLASLAVGITAFYLNVRFVSSLSIGMGLVMMGGNILFGRELVVGNIPRSYTMRGPVVRGQVEVRAGLNNFVLDSCPNDRIATMRYGPFGSPDFNLEDGAARLRFRTTLFRPNLTQWNASLAGNVLWEIDARSMLGDMSFDLANLRVDQVFIRSPLGFLTVRLPQRGYTEMNIRSALGRIEVTIPEEVGARIVIHRKALGSLSVMNRRLVKVAPDRLTTHDYEQSQAQVDVRIISGAGDIILR